MDEYLNLDRRFGLSTKFDSLPEFEGLGKRLTWDQVLEGRLSLIKARANFGKSVELEACAKRLRKERRFAAFIALHRVLGQDDLATALGPEDEQAYSNWRVAAGEHLFLFVDSLDEAALGREEGLQLALRRLTRAVNWPNSNVTWVLSSRPATLTPEVLELLQAELRTTLYSGATQETEESNDDKPEFFTERKQTEQLELADATGTGLGGAAASSAEAAKHKVDPLKVYDLLPLDNSAARLYLGGRHSVADPKEMLAAARKFGLGGLTAGPGSLDILVFADLVGNPPNDLSDAFDRMVRGVHAQQRADRRERQVGNPSPESLTTAVEKLASASVVCQLPNIELSQEALEYREGVLSSRPIVGALLPQDSLTYLLGSRLFIDSGHHQVKVYPDELLPYLAAKRLAARVQSPEDAARLLANFTWSASTGECGVHRVYLPLAGWLSTLSSHCRHELMTIEPQAVAFFGDLRSPQTSLAQAAEALTAAIERLVNVGDVLGRRHYTLTIENFWQVGKPGIADTLRLLFERHADDWRARDTLLDIATYVRLDLFRERVMRSHGWSYANLLKSHDDLHYIMSLERDDDGTALAKALVAAPDVAEQVASTLLTRLAWKWLDAREMAEVAATQFLRGRGAFRINWALTRDVADDAEPRDLYVLTRALLIRLVRSFKAERTNGGGRRLGHEFVELVMDMLALVIDRAAASSVRVSRLCLVLHRLVRDFHQGTADKQKLGSALEKSTEVRRLFLRGLIEGTDGSSDAIWRAVFLYGTFVVWLDGDDTAIAEPGFTAMVAELKARATMPLPPEPPRIRRGPQLDKTSKAQLLAVIDGLRDASNEKALAWVAGWLTQTNPNSRYGECDFSIFAAQAGETLAAAVRSGLSAAWRTRAPRWDEGQLNSTYQITIAGLQGLHLDLGDGSSLPVLGEQEVGQAIRYAQFEINGFPKWFWPVVRTRESAALDEFRTILGNAAAGAVSADKAEALIRHLDEAPAAIQRGLAGEAWAYVVGSAKAQEYATESALTVATTRGGSVDRATFEREAWSRITAAFDKELPTVGDAPLAMTADEAKARQELEAAYKEQSRLRANATVWGLFWLWHFPDSFGRDWEAWRASNRRASEEFMFDLAANLGEDRKARLRDAAGKGIEGLTTLKTLYEWVISVVRETDDLTHEDGRVYSVGARDNAQRLRDALLPAIASAKSQAAYDILGALRDKAVGARAKYIRQLQFTMREDAAATPPLAQQNYDRFEHDFAPPVSGYLSFAQTVHSDLLAVKRDIEQGEFSLRRFFNTLNFARVKTDSDGLALEADFQALLGSELNHASRGRYAVTLEPILPEMTRRDVLCQIADMRATVELKMSIRWSLEDYLVALEEQLKSQYMQAKNSKIGFFVVVLQETRRWDMPGGGAVDFTGLLEKLASKARELQASDPSLFLRVIGIDARPKEDFRAVRTAKAASARGAPKYSDGSGNTWIGRGPRPKWVKDALAAGRTLDEFLTTKQTGVGSPAANSSY
jgi:hypothetical protein